MRRRLLIASLAGALALSAPAAWACGGGMEMADCCAPGSPMHLSLDSGCHQTAKPSMNCCLAGSQTEPAEAAAKAGARGPAATPAVAALAARPVAGPRSAAAPPHSGPGHGLDRCALLSSFLL